MDFFTFDTPPNNNGPGYYLKYRTLNKSFACAASHRNV